jgi:uncharacterized protein
MSPDPSSSGLPSASVGVLHRAEWNDALESGAVDVDYVGVYAENFWWRGQRARRDLAALRSRHPLVSHGMSVPLCGPDEPEAEVVDDFVTFLDTIDARWWSEHIGIAYARGENLHDILPVAFTPEDAARIARRSQTMIARTGRPLLLENGAAYFRPPGDTLDEPEFLRRIVEASDVGLLLDVNNLYVNSQNFGFCPFDWLDRAPLSGVREIHIAGHSLVRDLGLLVDSHAAAPSPPVWRLLSAAYERIGAVPTLLEWERDPPGAAVVGQVLDRVRRAQRRAAGEDADAR